MDLATIQPELGEQFDKCTRCLQPVPVRAARCPGCGQPHRSRRWIPLVIGVFGLCALVFVMALMYYAAWRADLANADVPQDSDAKGVMVKVPDDASKAAEPPPPEKKPPLNEK